MPMICMNAISSKKGRWTLLRQDSKFADCRRVRMQKTSKEIPAGTVAVVLAAHGERVECRLEGGQSKRNSTYGKSTRVRKKKRLWVVGKEFTHGIVESTEIDLTELEEENLEDGDIGENGESSNKWSDADTTNY
ncbi:hypothetical protein L1987_77915 [Smallanthus sonchifolius]|uniref:Uncharacterized protein n=1 Tax=Smallanthus sonchifolius TaxID=185202 RepID=A0ACB8ZC74_9ASTR|nr:hypothetical protein L1987_77915 [Smallanthus sonchifolius]